MARPGISYTKTDDGAHIAYQVIGDGPIDVVFIPWWWNNLDSQWDDPLISHFLERLANFARLIVFDMRGIGLSDPASLQDLPTLERWMDDAKAVLDAVGSTQATVIGHGDGGLVAILFAATYPARTSGLVLVDAYALLAADGGYEGWEPEFLDRWLAGFEEFWGTGDIGWVGTVAPSHADSEEFRDQLARLERQSVSPGAAAAMQLVIGHLDVRPILPAISAPTLVLAHHDDIYIPPSFGRYLADHIPDATMIELEGADHLYWVGDADAALDEIEHFATGTRTLPRAERILATVLFTDIAGSTRLAAELGDQRWGQVLENHHALVRRQLERFRGSEVKVMGDGFLATFDGPARAIACACAIRDATRQIGLGVRAGLHTGEIEIGGSDIAGLAVHIGQRVSSLAEPGEVLVSRTVVDLVVGSGTQFSDRGEHELKGVPGRWRVFAVDT
ncbi:MAG TPA: adenylate/guanylate cyclase domain-containing protein [Acidimicrobiales bacterium]